MDPFLETKYPGRDYVLKCDLATAQCALRPLSSSGNRAYQASAARQNPPKWLPNMAYRRLLRYNQARNLSRILDGLESTVAYVRNTLSHLILRHWGAAVIILVLTSARAPRCFLCSFVKPCADGLRYPKSWKFQRFFWCSDVALNT